MRVFRDAPLREILEFLATGGRELAVPDPDRGRQLYAGERVDGAIHRPWRVWVDVAERLELRLLTPRAIDGGLVELRFEALAGARPASGDYGADSVFARISKLDDPGFVIDLREALSRSALPRDARVLDLGVHT